MMAWNRLLELLAFPARVVSTILRLPSGVRIGLHRIVRRSDTYDDFMSREIRLKDDEKTKVLYDRLYADLSILDTKGGALLQFISLIVTVFSLILSPSIGQTGRVSIPEGLLERPYTQLFLVVGAAFAYASAAAAFVVIWVRWASSDDAPERRARHIFRVRKVRTRAYRWACRLSLASLSCLVVHLALANLP
ncbi:hypothetical protein [Falsiroseomonas sp. E2-1-a20]|uniref:hypothetical protein n=1 Tax=Falsiroseomonas sp. E2-1-a20 TaxID=3239300 RepID=UPI003F361FA9